jgi:hypothetical protein
MLGLDSLAFLFVVSAFLFQIVLNIHFALRKWHFDLAIRVGWIVYALSVPAATVSLLLLLGGKPWSLWLGGFIYLIWATLGYTAEYVKDIQWRNPIRWSIFAPYVFLYLATVMFYWWPLALISRPLWYMYAVLFVISTILNVTSHNEARDPSQTLD